MASFAGKFFKRYADLAEFVDAEELEEQMEVLAARGLDMLNERILATASVSELLDVVAEHNVAARLIACGFSDLLYEPLDTPKPVDFVGSCQGRVYRVEVKRLASHEHDELHADVMSTLNHDLGAHAEPARVYLEVDETFRRSQINPLSRAVKAALTTWEDGCDYYFPGEADWVVRFRFYPAATLAHPRVGSVSDVDARNVTGRDASRVTSKLKSAYPKFKAAPADEAVHVVILEAMKTVSLSSVAEALYGREQLLMGRCDIPPIATRSRTGAFRRGEYSRLGGVVVARRATYRLLGPYETFLFPNPAVAVAAEAVSSALSVPRIFGPDDFPRG